MGTRHTPKLSMLNSYFNSGLFVLTLGGFGLGGLYASTASFVCKNAKSLTVGLRFGYLTMAYSFSYVL